MVVGTKIWSKLSAIFGMKVGANSDFSFADQIWGTLPPPKKRRVQDLLALAMHNPSVMFPDSSTLPNPATLKDPVLPRWVDLVEHGDPEIQQKSNAVQPEPAIPLEVQLEVESRLILQDTEGWLNLGYKRYAPTILHAQVQNISPLAVEKILGWELIRRFEHLHHKTDQLSHLVTWRSETDEALIRVRSAMALLVRANEPAERENNLSNKRDASAAVRGKIAARAKNSATIKKASAYPSESVFLEKAARTDQQNDKHTRVTLGKGGRTTVVIRGPEARRRPRITDLVIQSTSTVVQPSTAATAPSTNAKRHPVSSGAIKH